jgi:hypothetical protein
VPWYSYLASQDIDEVGFSLRTASLMTQPEFHFQPRNLGDYALFGIRYLVLPARTAPPPRLEPMLIMRGSRYWVYELPGNSYLRVADTVGSVTADRVNIGSRTVPYLHSPLAGQGRYLTVGYAGAYAAAPTLRPGARPGGPAGTVLAQHTDLANGTAQAQVRLHRRAVVVLAASFDPGWSTTIDGRPATIQMLAPALMGVAVPPGTHRIAFQYTGFGGYPPLLALEAAILLALAVTTRGRLQTASGLPGSTPDPSQPVLAPTDGPGHRPGPPSNLSLGHGGSQHCCHPCGPPPGHAAYPAPFHGPGCSTPLAQRLLHAITRHSHWRHMAH